ncbi:hypothetical protein ACO2Q3_13690 [Caulobacter sp. KR2-114]|uniref:hypothetical protein n=1 Tax=Caulobacter sp. KR2-114 TaxID=3400912 RepID=UPI003C007328
MSITGVSQITTQTTQNSAFQRGADAFNSLDQALSSGDLSSAQSAFSTLQSLGPQGGKAPPGGGSDPMSKDMAAVSSALQSGDLAGAQKAFAQMKTDMQAHRGHHHKPAQDATSTPDSDGDAAAANSTVTTATSGPIDVSNGVDITA